MSYNKTMRLSELKKGITVVLKKINTEENIERHLKNLGLVPGTSIDILLNSANGTVVVVRDGKLALGKEIAQELEVDIVNEQMLC